MKKHLNKIIGLLIIILFFAFGFYQEQVSRVSENSEPVLFKVNENKGLNKILVKLEEDGLIRSNFYSKVQAKLHRMDRVYAGLYEFNPSMTSYEILGMLNNPSAADKDVTIRLTEGFWAKDMAEEMVFVTDIESEEFLKLWNDKKFIKKMIDKYDFLPPEILEQEDARVLLEGYLYPDTYRINPQNTVEEVTEIILRNGQSKFKTIKDLMEESELTQHEIYTLASIVEYEAGTNQDMKKVAGVFMNRLDIDMKLQSSVTVCYSLYDFEDWTECESGENIQIDSPYNTYKYKGLPPGPILNPSIKAIKATLDFDDNEYFFFIADVYNVMDGKVHFQETYEEHERLRMELLGY